MKEIDISCQKKNLHRCFEVKHKSNLFVLIL